MTQFLRYTYLIISMLAFGSTLSRAQKGENTYQFLQLPNSARTAGLGGMNVSLTDNDLSLSYHNPALLSDTLDQTLSFNYCNYLLDLNYGYTAYAKKIDKYGMFALSTFYMDYGNWTETDIYGNDLGSFAVKEMVFNIMWSYALNDKWQIGATLKPIYSIMESYKSFGLASDLGLHYTNKERLLSAGFVIKNAGLQITTYTPKNREALPFEITGGISKRLAYAPFRFSVTFRHLQQFDIAYATKSNTANEDETYPNTVQILGRHLTLGLEFIPSDNFYIMGGYNAQRRAEMSIDSNPGLAGFSWGVGLKISKFNISYSSARYHLAGRTNFFSISTNLNRFM